MSVHATDGELARTLDGNPEFSGPVVEAVKSWRYLLWHTTHPAYVYWGDDAALGFELEQLLLAEGRRERAGWLATSTYGC